MSSKAETQSLLQGFVKFVERKFDTNVKAICSDNVAKFIMSHFFQAIGIIHQTTCVETPQKMGLSKENINIYLT